MHDPVHVTLCAPAVLHDSYLFLLGTWNIKAQLLTVESSFYCRSILPMGKVVLFCQAVCMYRPTFLFSLYVFYFDGVDLKTWNECRNSHAVNSPADSIAQVQVLLSREVTYKIYQIAWLTCTMFFISLPQKWIHCVADLTLITKLGMRILVSHSNFRRSSPEERENIKICSLILELSNLRMFFG